MSREDFLAGKILLIDKPLEWSSFQVVNKLRWLIRQQFKIKKIKVGHAGTLDPLASGLLIICTGKATKQINELQGQIKEYTGTIQLGATTPSYDLETEINATFPTEHITKALIHSATSQFIGEIDQLPPVFSALKKDGKRLYEFARKGEEVKVAPRKISIDTFEITKIDGTAVDFRVVCSKGTYIRSLAYDFGKALDSGGHLTALRRAKIGDYDVDNAQSVTDFEAMLKSIEEV